MGEDMETSLGDDVTETSEIEEEMLSQTINAHSPETQVKKKKSLLSEVLVNGLLKNINEKVCNKLDDEAQSELAGIVSQKVKEEGLMEMVDTGVSFENEPNKDHIIDNANKNRATLPQNRRPPTSRSQSRVEMPEGRIDEAEENLDSFEEDFENLLKDEDIDVDLDQEEVNVNEAKNEDDMDGDQKPKQEARKHRESYLEDFEALLKENSGDVSPDCDTNNICDIDADFDALLEEENVVIQSPSPVKSEPEDNKAASDKSDINKDDGSLESCVNNNDDIMTEGNNNSVEETDNDVCINAQSVATTSDSTHTNDQLTSDQTEECEVRDTTGSDSLDTDEDEVQAMENELVASKLDCNHDDQPIEEQECPRPTTEEVELELDTSPVERNNDTEEEVTALSSKLESVDRENNIEIEAKPPQQAEETDHLADEINDAESSDNDDDDQRHPPVEFRLNECGKKLIVPTMDIPDKASLDLEILQDSREAELLIQLKHLSARVEAQDTSLAELKEENTVLKIQNQNLLESLNRVNSQKTSLFRKSSKEFQSLEPQDLDESAERKKLFLLEQELEDQKEVNKQLKAYVGDVLINIIVQNPEILEKKSKQ